MHHLSIGVAIIASAFLAAAAEGASPKAGAAAHPIVGKWEWTRPENACKEVYEFRADGSARIVSGEEITENAYAIDRMPGPSRLYRMKLKVKKDFGGKDCGDHDEDSTGEESIVYLYINAEKTMHVVCQTDSFDACFGPLTRVSQ